MEYSSVEDPNNIKELILAYNFSFGRLFTRKFENHNRDRIAHPEKEELKIKTLVLNNYCVTDEYNTPTVVISEEACGESEHSETQHESYEVSNNSDM